MKVSIEIYPKEIKKLLELLDLIEKKPEYIYKGDSSKSQEPIPIDNREVKKSTEPFSRKISDMPCESVKYNKKEPIPNKELDQSVQEVVNDLSGKEKLPGASNYDELEKLINDTKPKENDKQTTDDDSSTIKSDNPSHAVDSNFNSNFNDYDVKQFKDDIVKFFKYTFGIDITKD